MKKTFILLTLLFWATGSFAQSPKAPKEEDYYRMVTLPVPENILLESGGVATLPDGRIGVCTRRGDVWIIENPYAENGSTPKFILFASGLHEALGLAYKDNALYVTQRGELTKLVDKNGDGRADVYETVYAWPLSGHYHEYSYGPKIADDGSFFVTGNVAFGNQAWWRGESRVPWRGWTLKISPDGTMEPWATGMRSPCGIGYIDGEFFYGDNQGDWMGSGFIMPVGKGDFTGHPAGLRWTTGAEALPNVPVKITEQDIYSKIDPHIEKPGEIAIKPENNPNEPGVALFEIAKQVPGLKTPAVWLPHGILGISTSEIIKDETAGKFGPFAGQIFVGDQGQSKIDRVFLEKVNGVWQGSAFDFRKNFQSGILRMAWGKDGSLFAGETNRGWGSAGEKTRGLERLIWTGKVPFEMKAVRAMPDGFEVEFTMPVDKASAEDLASYSGRSFIYKYHPVYGSPTIRDKNLVIKGVKVSADGLKARIVVDDLRQYFIHEIRLNGVKSKETGYTLLHTTAYYTLNQIPDGEKLKLSEISTKNSANTKVTTTKPAAQTTIKPATNKVPTYQEVAPLLSKNTCTSCHQANKRQVGPAFAEVAKRHYTNEQLVDLIYNPKPQNWPDYSTEMPPMPQVPKEEALKIAAWINSLAPATTQKNADEPKK
jgi:cytochrome c551/c552